MKNIKPNILICFLVGITIFMLSGCSFPRISLSDQNRVSIEKQSSNKINILWTDVYEVDGQLYVNGVLTQRKGRSGGTIRTHVDVQIVSEDGTVVYEDQSSNIRVPRNRVGKGIDWKRFSIQSAHY